MSKPYSEADLSEQMSRDRTWRIREISDLKAAIERADRPLRPVLLRSLVTMTYAHWEGSIRFAAKKYLDHIALRRFRFDQLKNQFTKNYFLPRLAALSHSNSGISDRCALIDEILGSSANQFKHVNDALVDTRANLNFAVFSDICLVCGVDVGGFESKATFIDVVLLKRRNAIAHGEETLIGFEELDFVTAEAIGLMRAFGDALENQAYTRSYRAA